MLSATSASPARAAAPDQLPSPPGQINVVTINAKQNRVLGIDRFIRLFELSRALRYRPPAFDGGFDGGVTAPDIVMVQEIRPSNLEILERLLRQRYTYKYKVVGPSTGAAAFIANTDTVTLQGDVAMWTDVCAVEGGPQPDDRAGREYPIGRFTEVETGAPFTIAGMHSARNYSVTGQERCLERNVDEMKSQLSNEQAATIIGGDFNRRPVTTQWECDPNETSEPLEWWLRLTAPTDGSRAYPDAVKVSHLAAGTSLASEWTHQQGQSKVTCDFTERIRQSRIDYLFAADAVVAQAHADHPGWNNPANHKYSDHRFVWGRFVVNGPPTPAPPALELGQGGVVTLTWAPVDGVTSWVLYRASKGRAYRVLARLPAEQTTYPDSETVHGQTYRYAIAPVGADGGQGAESVGVAATADARGPQVTGVRPHRDATGVDVHTATTVFFDERIDPATVNQSSIRLFAGRTRVVGQVVIDGPRRLLFRPARALRKGQRYRAAVSGLADALGNEGPFFSWSFRTEERQRRPRR